MRKFLIVILLLLFNMIATSFVLAVDESEAPSVDFFELINEKNKSTYLMRKLNNGDAYLSNATSSKNNLSIDVDFKTVVRKTIGSQLTFKMDESKNLLISSYDNVNNFADTVGIDYTPDLKNIQNSSHKPSARLSDYSHFFVEYEDLFADNPAKLEFEFLIETDKKSKASGKEFLVFSTRDRDLVEVDMENVSSSTWKSKDRLYLFKRAFGLKSDSDWRYTQDGENTVLQRRFDEPLFEYNVLNLLLANNTPLKGVNFRLKNKEGSEVIVEWASLSKQVNYDDNGMMKVSLYLDKLLKEQELYLSEVIVFIEGNVDQILKSKPLHSLHRLAYKSIKINELDRVNYKVINSVSQTEKFNYNNKILKFDIAEITNQVGLQSEVSSVKLTLRNDQDKKSGIHVSKVRLVSLFDREVPAVIELGEKQLQKWGAKYSKVYDNSKLINWPSIDTYTSNIGSVIESNSKGDRWVDLIWEVDTIVDKDSFLHLESLKSLKSLKIINDQVVGIRATLFDVKKEIGSWYLNIEDSIKFNSSLSKPKKISQIKFRIFLKSLSEEQLLVNNIAKEKNLKMREGVALSGVKLFRIKELNFSEILKEPSLIKHDKLLKKFVKAPTINKDLYFSTSVEREHPSDGDFVNIKYKAPWVFSLINPCWLKMRVLGEQEQEYDICMDSESGVKEIRLPIWANTIEWRVALSELDIENNFWKSKGSKSIELLFTGKWGGITTLNEKLMNGAIFKIDNKNFVPFRGDIKPYSSKLYFGLNNIKKNTQLSDLKILENPWWNVDKVVLDQGKVFSLDEWRESNKGFLTREKGNLIWLKILSTFFILWLIFSSQLRKLWKGIAVVFLWLWRLTAEVVSKFNIVSWRTSFWCWTLVALVVYAIGIMGGNNYNENYWFIIGNVTIVLAWRSLSYLIQPLIESHYPSLSKKVYVYPGARYFFGFFLTFIGVACMLMLSLDVIAEQLSTIGYFMLVTGIVLEIFFVKRNKINT